MNKNSPLDIARALGRSIQVSPEYKGVQNAYEELLDDDHALSLLEEQRKLKVESKNHRALAENYEIEFKRIENEIDSNKVIQEYYQRQSEYTKLLNNINGIIDHYIENFTLSNQGCHCDKKCHK